MERRQPKIKIGRRKSDIPVVALEQFKDEMKVHVSDTIERVVNGKIKDIDTKLTTYITGDEKWKKDNEPALQNMKNITSTGKLIVSLSLGITAIGGAFIVIKNFFK